MREHQRQGCLPQLRRQANTGMWASMAVYTTYGCNNCCMMATLPTHTLWYSSMTVPFSPDTGRLASMTVTSSTDTSIWACMLITFTMTVNMNHYYTIGHVDCVIQPRLVTHSMGLLSQHGQSPHGHLILTGYQQHRDGLEDGVHSRYSALTGQEDTHSPGTASTSSLTVSADNLQGNDQEASKYQVRQQVGLGHSHPNHQQGDGQVHHAHLLQHCNPEPVPEHHASRPVLSIRISVLSLQKLNNMKENLAEFLLLVLRNHELVFNNQLLILMGPNTTYCSLYMLDITTWPT